MAVQRWNISRALYIGAVCGLLFTAYNALVARGWAVNSDVVIQTFAGGIGGAFWFWLATKFRNWLVFR